MVTKTHVHAHTHTHKQSEKTDNSPSSIMNIINIIYSLNITNYSYSKQNWNNYFSTATQNPPPIEHQHPNWHDIYNTQT